MTFFAKIISYLFHPLLIPTFGLMLIFSIDSYLKYLVSFEVKKFIVLFVAMSTFLLPALLILFMHSKKMISEVTMRIREERTIPYAITIGFYLLTLYIFKDSVVPEFIFKFMIRATLLLILTFIINLKWKISAHMVAIGGLLGALASIAMVLNVYVTHYIVLVVLLSGLIASSRLRLKAHSPAQVYTGFVLGIVGQLGLLY